MEGDIMLPDRVNGTNALLKLKLARIEFENLGDNANPSICVFQRHFDNFLKVGVHLVHLFAILLRLETSFYQVKSANQSPLPK